jgi:uncharacterized protein YodC (DUF2158 family)
MGAVAGYKCRWFDEKNKLTEHVFTEAELASYSKPSGGKVWLASTRKGL